MLTIATYRNLMAAELAKTRLDSCDIRAVLADTSFYTLGYGSIMEGIRLQVPEEDAERAKEILSAGEFVDLPDHSTLGNGTESIAGSDESEKPPAGDSLSSRSVKWLVLSLLLAGIFCLVLGQPAGDFRGTHPYAGELFLLGIMLIVAGLWISYGRLSVSGGNEMPPEEDSGIIDR